MKKLLTIAGSDSSGGAGIQADLKTFAANMTYGMSVITAITAQNTKGVISAFELPEKIIEEQLDAVFTDIFPDAVKIGMVSSPYIVEVIAKALKKYKPEFVVTDPVMVATSGGVLMKSETVEVLEKILFPLSTLITPNIYEGEILSWEKIKSKEDMSLCAKKIAKNFNVNTLLKGGHYFDNADDLLVTTDSDYEWFEGPKIPNENNHGTGCTLSSAIAVFLAKGQDLKSAVRSAKNYVTGALKCDFKLGKGRGPLNHIYNIKEK